MTTPTMTTSARPPLWRTAIDISALLAAVAVWLVAAGWTVAIVVGFVFGVDWSVAQGALAATLVGLMFVLGLRR